MELDIRVESDSLAVPIENPFRLDLDSIMDKIDGFLSPKGLTSGELDVKELIPKLVKGVAGCEKGCPADAKTLVSRGFKGYHLEYVEGGILSAKTKTKDGRELNLKMFPDF